MSSTSQPNGKNPWNLPNTTKVPPKAAKKPNKNFDSKFNSAPTTKSNASKSSHQQQAKSKALQLSKGYESSSDEEIESQTIGTTMNT